MKNSSPRDEKEPTRMYPEPSQFFPRYVTIEQYRALEKRVAKLEEKIFGAVQTGL